MLKVEIYVRVVAEAEFEVEVGIEAEIRAGL